MLRSLRIGALCFGILPIAGIGAPAHAQTYTVVHAFPSNPQDGYEPAGLTRLGNLLYGTTSGGGANGTGTAYSLTPGGEETVLYAFGSSGSGDGNGPNPGLVNVNGIFYGTTSGGGAYNQGTVFSVTAGGAETILHSFGSTKNDGANPNGYLIRVGKKLFGTTQGGGRFGLGTVFSITTGGLERITHAFIGAGYGSTPNGGLLRVGNILYGTTIGVENTDDGVVYALTFGGGLNVLHRFLNTGSGDGLFPNGNLLAIGNLLYGTTAVGGTSGVGTVFSVTPGGALTILHAFQGYDGDTPSTGLTQLGSLLYGATNGSDDGSIPGNIYAVTLGGTINVLHVFANADGTNPRGNLLPLGGLLFGTTTGNGPFGTGDVFSIIP